MERGITRVDAFVLVVMLLSLVFATIFFQSKLVGLFSLLAPQSAEQFEQGEAQKSELTSQPKIEVIELQVPDCNLCLNFDTFKNQLRHLDIALQESTLPYNSEEAKELIEKYDIKAVPTIIVRGDINKVDALKNWEDIGTIESDALVFRNNVPVYYDLEKKRFIGAVRLIELIDPSCTNCLDPLRTIEMSQLLSAIKLVSFRRVDVNSTEGQELIRKYFIDFAPALIFSAEIADYNKDLFSYLGSFSPNGSFIVRKKYPPYKDLPSGEVRGLLSLAIIEVSNCWACKDAKDMLNFLNTKLGLSFANLTVYDANTFIAQEFIKNYSIQYLPAAIVTGDTKSYELFKETWPKIGKVFVDGSYVLDGYPWLGAGYYYDLNTGEVVLASQQQ
jgi:hypothetical protein